jgi:Bacteriocin-protection, YdeI or OmpD-Associated
MTSWRLSPIKDTSASRPSSSWKAPARNARDGSTIRFDARIRKIEQLNRREAPPGGKRQAAVSRSSRGDGTNQRHPLPDGRGTGWQTGSLAQGRQTLQPAPGSGQGGDVAVELEPTKDWSGARHTTDFQSALASAPELSELWQDITPMARWEWVRWINATKNPEARRRRVEVGISKLRSGKRRPCCFNLAACTDPDLSKNGKLVEVA